MQTYMYADISIILIHKGNDNNKNEKQCSNCMRCRKCFSWQETK